jgi:REP-associated tyrosine transposase
MGRPHRAAQGGFVHHLLNRANARIAVLQDNGRYEAFDNVLAEMVEGAAAPIGRTPG